MKHDKEKKTAVLRKKLIEKEYWGEQTGASETDNESGFGGSPKTATGTQ